MALTSPALAISTECRQQAAADSPQRASSVPGIKTPADNSPAETTSKVEAFVPALAAVGTVMTESRLPTSSTARARIFGSPITTGLQQALTSASPNALATISGPLPAGSPMVTAMFGLLISVNLP